MARGTVIRPGGIIVAITQVEGNGTTYQEVTPTYIAGYKAIGIVGYTSFGNYKTLGDLYDFYMNTSANKLCLNWKTAQPTGEGLNVYLLYARE